MRHIVVVLFTTFLTQAVFEASAGQTDPGEKDSVKGNSASRDYIRAEFKGQFTQAVGTGGEHTGFQITADGVTWEVDATASRLLLKKANELAGKLALAKGTYSERRGISRLRRILRVTTLEEGAPSGRTEHVTVLIRGTIRTGVFQIGGETTGATVTANGITWELELSEVEQQTAALLNKKKGLVEGRLRHKAGVEVKDRFIVDVEKIRPAM